MYLLIENQGVSDIDCWIKMGLSSTRENNDGRLIGKFGSGIKHAILTLLRLGEKPIIFLGNKELLAETVEKTTRTLDGPIDYQEVLFHFDGQTYPTGFTCGFGELDWTNRNMAIREFISNAIDASYKTTDSATNGCNVSYSLETTPKEGVTRVYIRCEEPFAINEHFLHWTSKENLADKFIIDKCMKDTCKVYRRGVLVGTLGDSLFNYNFDDIKLDESRNLDLRSAKHDITMCFNRFSVGQFSELLKSFAEPLTDGKHRILEANLSWPSWIEDDARVRMTEAWTNVFGKDAVAVTCRTATSLAIILEKIRSRGKKPVYIPNNAASYFQYWGIPTESSILSAEESVTKDIFELPADLALRTKAIWNLFDRFANVRDKKYPKIFGFEATDSSILGYYIHNTIYINKTLFPDHDEFDKTVAEELTHYITEQGDFTRQFQEFLLSALVNMGKELQNVD